MAQRTTLIKVQTILADNYGPLASGEYPNLQPYIDMATVVTDRVATCAAAKTKTLTATELELIERLLAAHYYQHGPDQGYTSKSTNGASATFQGKTELNFDGTKYGQSAMSIDYSGCLTAISKRQVARMAWLGKTPSEELEYSERD